MSFQVDSASHTVTVTRLCSCLHCIMTSVACAQVFPRQTLLSLQRKSSCFRLLRVTGTLSRGPHCSLSQSVIQVPRGLTVCCGKSIQGMPG
jgi:hypothetical protein